MTGWCRGCGAKHRYLRVRYCSPCLTQMVASLRNVERVERYAALIAPGSSLYDPRGWPLPTGCVWTRDVAEVLT